MVRVRSQNTGATGVSENRQRPLGEPGEPFNTATVEAMVRQFSRDRSRYNDMVDFVRRDLETVLSNELAKTVKVQWQSRVKDPDSLKDKLIERGQQPDKPAYATFPVQPAGGIPELLDRIPDLAGVRLLTYTDDDRERVVRVLNGAWGDESSNSNLKVMTPVNGEPGEDAETSPKPEPGAADSQLDYYNAKHIRVVVNGATDALRHLTGITCEVQIATGADHLLNEVGHDIFYKGQVRQSNLPVKQLMKAKSLVAELKQVLGELALVAVATEKEVPIGATDEDPVLADSAIWLPIALHGSSKPSEKDQKATDGKRKTIPYLVGLGAQASSDGEVAYLKALPDQLKAIDNETVARYLAAYKTTAIKRGWGRILRENPRHLQKSPMDKTIMALLIHLSELGILQKAPRQAGRPTVGQDIAACFLDAEAAMAVLEAHPVNDGPGR